MKAQPKVSVVIPTYNRVQYVCNAIDSVLAQTYQDFEIVIIDDGSTDDTMHVLDEYKRKYSDKIRIHYQKNAGVAIARNMGVSKSEGALIAFLDDDDEASPTWLENLHATLLRWPEAVVCVGRLVTLDTGRWMDAIYALKDADYIQRESYIDSFVTTNTLFKKEVFGIVGDFDATLKPCGEDVDMAHRIIKAGFKIVWAPEAIACYRRRPTFNGFLRQRYFYGYSKYLFHDKHEDLKSGLLIETARLFKNETILLFRMMARGIKFIFSSKRCRRMEFVLEHPVEMCGLASGYFGYMSALVKRFK